MDKIAIILSIYYLFTFIVCDFIIINKYNKAIKLIEEAKKLKYIANKNKLEELEDAERFLRSINNLIFVSITLCWFLVPYGIVKTIKMNNK